MRYFNEFLQTVKCLCTKLYHLKTSLKNAPQLRFFNNYFLISLKKKLFFSRKCLQNHRSLYFSMNVLSSRIRCLEYFNYNLKAWLFWITFKNESKKLHPLSFACEYNARGEYSLKSKKPTLDVSIYFKQMLN